ncbi:MAG: sucA [Rickettsiaceae bacterium]|jgi:2-oxoglutarate dehydrogenase E1 component|nr:sucA [Rickettsiaceae bacterium]
MTKQQPINSTFFSGNLTFIQELFSQYLKDKNSVDQDWQKFFADNFDDLDASLKDKKGASWANRNLKVVGGEEFDISSLSKKELKKDLKAAPVAADSGNQILSIRTANLILAYKRFGHLGANLDPLALSPKKTVPELTLEFHNIGQADLDKEVELGGLLGFSKAKVSDVISLLDQIYKNTIGSQFTYINDSEIKNWLAKEIETAVLTPVAKQEKIKILKEIIRTEKFEQFLHKRFPGAKRFSVEGGDSSIAAIEKIIDVAAKDGVKKIIFGMAHRGRLNVLTGVMQKPYHQIFSEFQGTPGIPSELTKSGDVKYHMGYSSTRNIDGKKIDLSLAFNPSHLEVVNPVVAGRVRATQDQYQDESRTEAMAFLIHGDAAFAGQGSVAEALMMSGLRGYDVGGIVHLIINNQIGFTANPEDSRSTTYASDLAKGIDAPIFHVNGDDAEAVVRVAHVIAKYRQVFKKDVVIDLICYRKYGHNEGDEPLYTQPLMYSKIKNHPSLEAIYSKQLIDEGTLTEGEYQKMVDEFNNHLGSEFDAAAKYKPKEGDWLKSYWKHIKADSSIPNTKVPAKKLKELSKKISQAPQNFNANPKIIKQMEERQKAVEAGEDIDWGNGEALAFASLLDEGFPVRITGQDSGRGTFSHRHSVLHDAVNGQEYLPLNSLGEKAAKYEVHDSILSELGVLGFEYGYSLASPDTLTIWEAQFGDFANGAQMIFDQFIASSEVKWLRKSGLVCLLPHGYEGQGPEHSSARLERFLQLCADDNMRVVNITTPANFFHCLRRQIHSQDRKPLIVMSPKSLLRHKLAVSKLADFTDQNFQTVIGETEKLAADAVKKVVLCSGKVYYDLLQARTDRKINNVALVRVEQLYPFPAAELETELKKYKNAEIVWCQEEPKNMGSWHFISELLENVLIKIKAKYPRPKYVGRVASASPATGYGSYHAKEQAALIEEALS